MNIDFAVVCDYALVDQFGKLSVIGLFQHIWVQKFPTIHPRLHLVIRLRGSRTEVGQHDVQIRLLNEEDEEIINGEGKVNFPEPPAGVLEVEAGAVLAFDVPFKKPGKYRFEIKVDSGAEAVVPIAVSLGPSPTPPAQGQQRPPSKDQ
jgi:hypothetical protein